jgi:hypothetical protein
MTFTRLECLKKAEAALIKLYYKREIWKVKDDKYTFVKNKIKIIEIEIAYHKALIEIIKTIVK